MREEIARCWNVPTTAEGEVYACTRRMHAPTPYPRVAYQPRGIVTGRVELKLPREVARRMEQPADPTTQPGRLLLEEKHLPAHPCIDAKEPYDDIERLPHTKWRVAGSAANNSRGWRPHS